MSALMFCMFCVVLAIQCPDGPKSSELLYLSHVRVALSAWKQALEARRCFSTPSQRHAGVVRKLDELLVPLSAEMHVLNGQGWQEEAQENADDNGGDDDEDAVDDDDDDEIFAEDDEQSRTDSVGVVRRTSQRAEAPPKTSFATLPASEFDQDAALDANNPLLKWFTSYSVGPIVWKYPSYFYAYHLHFRRFRTARRVVMLQIGVQSGGDIVMWRDYFKHAGEFIYHGVDMNPLCKRFEQRFDNVHIHIGDQGNRTWLEEVLVPRVRDISGHSIDIVNDDGSHTYIHQRISFDVLYDHVPSNGIYMVEDTHKGALDEFVQFAVGRIEQLYTPRRLYAAGSAGAPVGSFAQTTGGISFYESIVVFEKHDFDYDLFRPMKKGTEKVPCHGAGTTCV